MSKNHVQNRTWVKTILIILGIIPLISGIAGLSGWVFDQELLSSFKLGLVPMAPSSALLFIILSLLYILHPERPRKPVFMNVTLGLTILVIATGLTLFILSILNIQTDVERLGLRITTGYDNGAVGHMSPVSSLLFTVLGIAFLFFRILSKNKFSMVIPTSLSGFAALLSIVFLVGYIIGKPFMYGMDFIPPAFSTTLSFVSLSMAFAVESFIQEQKKMVDAVSAIDERFRNAFEHSAEGKSMIYPDGTFQVNHAFAEMLGYTISELSELTWKPVTHPDDREKNQEMMDRMIHGHIETARFEKRYIHKNGQVVWADMQSYLQRDRSGNPLYFITSASDITASKKLQEQLILAKEQAEQSNQLKDAFIANMSHEIRTPLNAILGFCDLVQDDLALSGSKEYDSHFDIIRSSGLRLMRTVDMIMNVSRLQVGAYEVRPVRIKLQKMISDLVTEYRLPATKKGLSMEFRNELDDPEILADEYCILHSLSNLFDNAVKYTRSGNILITLYRSENNAVCLDVKDSGIGISEEFLGQIFHPFTQEQSSSTRQFEGIGLGLSIAYRMLAVTGSNLTVESKKGVGTTFTVTFPQ